MAKEHCYMARNILCLLFLQLLVVFGTVVQVNAGGCIGAIVDDASRAGKEEKLAMIMAMEDFRESTGDSSVVLQTMASNGDPVRAASAALSLINERRTGALVGLHAWQEASFVAEIGKQARVPVLSFTRAAPPSVARRWPFFVRVARNQHAQMRAVAAVVGSWRWRRATVLYEDADYAATSIIPHLADALRAVGSEVDRRVPVPASPSSTTLQEELNSLKSGQCRVFVVHTSAKIAAALFAEASRMGMIAPEYVWIVTDAIAGAVDSMGASTVASMEGVIGVRNHHLPNTNSKSTRALIARFKKRFQAQYADDDDEEEKTRGPHYPALLAYDTIWAVASAMRKINATSPAGATRADDPKSLKSGETIKISVSSHGSDLLDEIRGVGFDGASGEFRFERDGEFAPPKRFQLINVAGRSYTELGFWSPEHGFSKSVECNASGCGPSMSVLGAVIWPGRPWGVPRGWAPASGRPFTVAVPEKAVFPDFVKVTYGGQDDPSQPRFEGFSIDVFRAAVDNLPYHLPYKFVPFNETTDSLTEHDRMRNYDILVGDTTISSGRYKFVEFSQPYTESGLVMVVPFRMMDASSRSWIFLRPFTPAMWFLTATVGLYNGIVIWLIERKYNDDYRAGLWKQVTTVFWLSFTTLLSPGERLNSSLSRVSMVVWLFVAVMLAANYTASLTSLLTVQRLEAAVTVESLRAGGAAIGCASGSGVDKYLEEVLLFPEHSVRRFSRDEDYRRALSSGEVKAAFLRVSHAKLLLTKYCNELMTTGPVYHVGGLGFVFPKGSPLLADISQAILKLFENGTIHKLETAMLSAYNCSATGTDGPSDDLYRLNPENFCGLFVMTLFASTASLTVYGVFFHHDTAGGGCHRKQGDGCKDSTTVDPGGWGLDEEVPAVLTERAGIDTGKESRITGISMGVECEHAARMPHQR